MHHSHNESSAGRRPLSIVALVICISAFIAFLYTERISSLSSSTSFFSFKSCSKRGAIAKSIKSITVKSEVDDREIHYKEISGNREFALLNSLYLKNTSPRDETTLMQSSKPRGEYNATIEFYWVGVNSDNPIIADPKNRILRVDSASKHAKFWMGIIWKWGRRGRRVGYTPIANKIGLKTWVNWIDSNIDPNKTVCVLHYYVPYSHK
ncbi:unnamed protein product [Camellia sinensis]